MQFNCNKGLLLSALSGGADSTALLLWLLEKGCKVEAVHCNFHLRGEESDRDEHFCQELCRKLGVKLHIVHFDTVTFAQMHHQSIETAARNLRYRYFLDLACDIDADGICVAHNRNDQAETLLMNLVRGAGIHGLTGMKRERTVYWRGRKVSVIRPLLDVSRKEIVRFLNERNQTWVTDSTNLETDATRNKLRLEVIPLLENINPSAIANIADACIRLQTVEKVYDAEIGEGRKRVLGNMPWNNVQTGSLGDSDKSCYTTSSSSADVHININLLLKEPSPEALLFEIVRGYGFNGSQTEDILAHLEDCSGKRWISDTHCLIIDRKEIIIVPLGNNEKVEMHIPEDGIYVVDRRGKLKVSCKSIDNDFVLSKSKDSISLDAGKVAFPLTIRTTERGDRFVPFGMRGSKLVSDFLTDIKLSIIDKERQLVLCDSTGSILWVVGRRPDNRFRITQKTTNVMSVSFSCIDDPDS